MGSDGMSWDGRGGSPSAVRGGEGVHEHHNQVGTSRGAWECGGVTHLTHKLEKDGLALRVGGGARGKGLDRRKADSGRADSIDDGARAARECQRPVMSVMGT